MNSKKLFLTFSILAVVYWTCSILGYGWYMDRVKAPGSSEYIFMLVPVVAGILFVLAYLIAQLVSLSRQKSSFVKTKVFLSFIGICFVCLSAYMISLMRNPVLNKVVLDVLSGHNTYSLVDLSRRLLDAEGLDLFFCFVLALISGHIVYSKKIMFDVRGFGVTLLAWAVILSVKEVIKYYLPLRDADILDIVKNMTGGVLPGLVLSSRWFWK